MAKHFDDADLWMTEFTQLPSEMVLQILQSEHFFVSTESFLWSLLKIWAKADLLNRKKQLAELADHIKFLGMSVKEYFRVVRELAQMTGVYFNTVLALDLENTQEG